MEIDDLSRPSLLRAIAATIAAAQPFGWAGIARAGHGARAAQLAREAKISFFSVAEAADVAAVTAQIVPPDRFFTNAIDTRTNGVDVTAKPKDSLQLGGGWSRKGLGVNFNLARYGEFCSFTLNPADDQDYSPKWLTDLEASYQIAGYMLAVGAQNLLDVFPDRNGTVNSFNGIQTFPRQSPFMNGRAIYARIGRRF